MNGVILINKEKGCTSRDVVNAVSKILNTKKIGHFGTLDPLAEGLLILGIGSYTKIGNYLKEDTKEYIAEVLIGTSTDTYDITGTILKKEDNYNLNKKILEEALSSFKGKYMQEVPIYSAVKVGGRKLYDYARNGEEVSLPKKEVEIFDIELLDIYKKEENNYFKFKVSVSKGTYIRSLINDLSRKINIPLCMSNLTRTRQDKFLLKDAYKVSEIENGNYKLLNIREIIDLEEKEIDKTYEKKVLKGSLIEENSNKYILFTKNKEDIVLYGPYKDKMKPYLFFKKDLK